ncbi:MAG TPA: hypothetical protein VF695_15830 [Sphingomonas sp.]|jgi:hypothetical protein
MMSVGKLFADVTAALEDLHAVAVEGQAPDLTDDVQHALLGLLDNGLRELRAMLKAIRETAADV